MVGVKARDGSAVRAAYFLEPEGILLASTWYPLSVGRSVEEMLRLVAALQRVHDGTALAPEGWRPGDDLLAVPSQDIDDVLAAPDGTDWFYTLVRDPRRSEEHTSELQSLMRTSYAVFCLKKKTND